MKGLDDKHIDQMMQKAAQNFEPAYNPKAWAHMQAKMGAAGMAPVTSTGFWTITNRIIVGALLLLIITAGIIYFYSSNSKVNGDQIAEVESTNSKSLNDKTQIEKQEFKKLKDSQQNKVSVDNSDVVEESSVESTDLDLNSAGTDKSATQKLEESSSFIHEYNDANYDSSVDKLDSEKNNEQVISMNNEEISTSLIEIDSKIKNDITEKNESQVNPITDELLDSSKSNEKFNLDYLEPKYLLVNDSIILGHYNLIGVVIDSTVTVAEVDEIKNDYRKFSVSVLVSPDFSGTSVSKFKGTGIDFGVMIEYFINRRLSVNSGLQYGSKKYFVDEEFEGYVSRWPGRDVPDEIDASCTVLDIPINLRYYFYENMKTRIFLNAGVTSYIMLTEDYLYKYNNDYTEDWSVKVENENKHFLGLLNFSFGVQREVGKGFYVIAEPFYKSAIQGIGAGDVNLNSSGVYISIKKDF